MSFTDTILSNTVGVLFRARTGSVDPWTLAQQKADSDAAIKRALGANASAATIAAAQAKAKAEIESVLRKADAHPEQAPPIRLPIVGALDLPKLNKLVNGALVVLAVGAGLYFAVLYHKTLAREFHKLKKGK